MKKNLNNSRGMVLITVIGIIVVVMLLVPVMIKMAQKEAKWTVKEQENTTAFQLAEAAADRSIWKVKSATHVYTAAMNGQVVAGYNFDKTYDDVEGGEYRMRVSQGTTDREVVIVAEGRDKTTKNVRAIRMRVTNSSVPSCVMSAGMLEIKDAFQIHWGPVMSHNSIVLMGAAINDYFPRKFSKQVVSPRDPTGDLNPPNTDNTEWWSNFKVMDLPMIDFTTMKSSAATILISGSDGVDCKAKTGSDCTTLNYYRNSYYSDKTGTGYNNYGSSAQPDFYWTDAHPDSKENYIWYWSTDGVGSGHVNFTGSQSSGRKNGLWGQLIVEGNMTVSVGDDYPLNNAPMPGDAWREYAAIDTGSSNQYPGDTGFQSNAANFDFGSQSWSGGPPSGNTDLGFRGFFYVKGDLILSGSNSVAEYYGALWVEGDTIGGSGFERSTIFYDGNLTVPTLNVVLNPISWEEIPPDNATPWN